MLLALDFGIANVRALPDKGVDAGKIEVSPVLRGDYFQASWPVGSRPEAGGTWIPIDSDAREGSIFSIQVPKNHLSRKEWWVLSAVGVFGVASVGALDFLSGYQINLSFFYLAPIVYCTWVAGWRAGIQAALASGTVAMLADILMDKQTAHEIFSYWNAVNRLGFFLLAVFMVDRIRTLYARQVLLVESLNAALSEVRRLSGLLPMCSWCKKIRADSGYWQQVEEYLSQHSEAQFTHGICPDCYSRVSATLPDLGP